MPLNSTFFPRATRIATFYSLPKVHKGIEPLKGRPIVSGVESLSQNCGIFIDKILSPFVQSLSSFVRDTTDLLQRIDGLTIDPEHWLVSIDVEALYISISHNLSLKEVEYFLDTRGGQCRAHSRFVLDLLKFTQKITFFLGSSTSSGEPRWGVSVPHHMQISS